VQVCLPILDGEGIPMVPYNHLDDFDDRFVCFGGKLDVVRVELFIQFVVSAVISGFLRCALFFRFDGFFHLFWAFDNLAFFEIGRCLLRDSRSRGS